MSKKISDTILFSPKTKKYTKGMDNVKPVEPKVTPPVAVVLPKTNKQLYAELNVLVEVAQTALAEAQRFANENDLSFNFSPAYGMGGTFYPASGQVRNEYNETTWHNSDCYGNGDAEGRWQPSSQSC